MLKAFAVLASLKSLRGSALDVFGYSQERRMERALIAEFETDMQQALAYVSSATKPHIMALARLPLDIRGFGPVKLANAEKAAKRRLEILENLKESTKISQTAAE